MKKVILAAAFLMALSSCKKDRVCACSYTTLGVTFSTNYTLDATKAQAKHDCSFLQSIKQAETTGATVTCTLK